MFHIPFNKRYLINNQRYSLTGQPIVYIGKSVIDLVEELDVTDFDNFKVSTIQLPENIRIFDLRNKIIDDLLDLQIGLILDDTLQYQIGKFYKLILSSLCSFTRRQNIEKFSFCEEYVIPQLFAQVIKNRKYDGIMYQSTKAFRNISFYNNNIANHTKNFHYITDYMDNIAIFTNINTEHVYDHDLFNRLQISTPITMKMVDDINIKDLERIGNEIKTDGNQEKLTLSDTMISAYKRTYTGMLYKNQEYNKTDIGKLHLYHLFEVLHQILID